MNKIPARRKFIPNGAEPGTEPHLVHVSTNLFRNEPSGLYMASLSVNGKLHKRSLKTHDLDVAERRLIKLKHQLRGFNGEAARAEFSAFADHWLFNRSGFWKPSSKERRQVAIRALTAHFPCKLRDMSFQRVEAWAAVRIKQVMPRTFNYEREILRMILDYAVREQAIADNPVNGAPRARVVKRLLDLPTAEKLGQLFTWMALNGHRDASELAQFLAGSGLRISEAMHLRFGDIDWLHNTVTVRGDDVTGTKTGQDGLIPLFRTAAEAIGPRRSGPAYNGDDALIFNFIRERLQTGLDAGCKAVRIKRLKPHDFRHFFASEAIRRRVDVMVISKWLGHSTAKQVLTTYAHLISGQEKDCVALMDGAA